MNLNTNFFLKSFRVLLLPFSVLYGLIIICRNWLYDRKFLYTAHFNLPLICIGNLAAGGTGKSPMVEYLLDLLQKEFKVATLSRGYKRKTTGYVLANENSTALDIGDEPMQFHLKFPSIPVAVGEQRLMAIPELLQDQPDLDAIVLDDAFQHRSVHAGLNIILTDYSNLYYKDFFLPTGDLRDSRKSIKRADIIIVTKCPPDMSRDSKQKIIRNLNPKETQQIYFTTIVYDTPYHIYNNHSRKVTTADEVLLVCGIANPKPLKEYLLHHASTYYQKDYDDHHIFSIDDLNEIKEKFDHIDAEHKMILTTEKDAVRLTKFRDELKNLPMYVIPISHSFLFEEGEQFDASVIGFIRNFTLNPSL